MQVMWLCSSSGQWAFWGKAVSLHGLARLWSTWSSQPCHRLRKTDQQLQENARRTRHHALQVRWSRRKPNSVMTVLPWYLCCSFVLHSSWAWNVVLCCCCVAVLGLVVPGRWSPSSPWCRWCTRRVRLTSSTLYWPPGDRGTTWCRQR